MDRPLTRHAVAWAAALAALTWAVFGAALRFDFIFLDDDLYVFRNPVVLNGLTRDGVAWAFTRAHEGYWIPLTWLSYLVDRSLWGPGPAGFHATNVALHTLNVLLLFGLLLRTTRRPAPAALAAALFAVHPLRVESVVWITERKDVLSTAFWFAGLWAYARYAQRPGIARMLVVALAMALGLMAKPMLVTFPLTLLLMDVWPLRRVAGTAAALRAAAPRCVLEKAPLWGLAVLGACLTVHTQQQAGALPPVPIPPVLRLLTALSNYGFYLVKTLWPARLSAMYPPVVETSLAGLIAVAAVLLVGTALTVRRLADAPWLACGWFWFLGTLLPVVGLKPAGAVLMADRFTYVPLAGLFIALAWGLDAGFRAPAARRAAAAGAGLLMLLLAVLCHRQAGHWRDSEALFRHALAVAPDNPLALNNLGATLRQAGRTDEALGYFRRAVRMQPGYADALNNLSSALLEKDELAEALVYSTRAIAARPRRPAFLLNHGLVLFRQKHYAEAADALRELDAAFPGVPEVNYWLGAALQEGGRPAEAADRLRRVLAAGTDNAEVHDRLARACHAAGRRAEAAQHYRRVLDFQPQHPTALNNLAWLLATAPEPGVRDPARALAYARAAAALVDPPRASLLDTLAAAEAAAGDFAQATAHAAQAADLARAEGRTDLEPGIENHRRAYREGRAWTEP